MKRFVLALRFLWERLDPHNPGPNGDYWGTLARAREVPNPGGCRIVTLID